MALESTARLSISLRSRASSSWKPTRFQFVAAVSSPSSPAGAPPLSDPPPQRFCASPPRMREAHRLQELTCVLARASRAPESPLRQASPPSAEPPPPCLRQDRACPRVRLVHAHLETNPWPRVPAESPARPLSSSTSAPPHLHCTAISTARLDRLRDVCTGVAALGIVYVPCEWRRIVEE